MSNINFDNPYLLLIAVPLVVLFALPFALAIRKENVNGHNVASMALHVVMAVVIAFAAAGTTIRTVLTETDVYIVADVSYSTNAKLDTIDAYIRDIELPRNSRVGIVAFGKNAEILTNMGEPLRSVREATVDVSETDIAGALDFAGRLFKDGVIKRIVLITDGKPTDKSDAYAITRAVDNLEAKRIGVDAIYLDSNLGSDVHEVQITGVDYTRNAFRRIDRGATGGVSYKQEEADVIIQSTYATTVTLGLKCNGAELSSRRVELSVGKNNYPLMLDASAEGTYDYEVTVTAEDDFNTRNNSYLFTQTVSDKRSVLFVTESWVDAKAALERYPEDTAIDIYENDVVESDRVIDTYCKNFPYVTVTHNLNVPNSINELCKYDEYVLAGIKLADIEAYGAFVNSLDTAVSQYGKSLYTVGALDLETSTDDSQTALEDMLPVRFGNADRDARLFTIVVDASRSMNKQFHLIVAKQLAVKLLDMLKDGDEFCIIDFYSDAMMLLAPTPVTAGNRQSIIDTINKIGVSQGTVIHGGLMMAYNQIKDIPIADKQVMLISDGINFDVEGKGVDDARMAAQQMRGAGIAVNVFDIGRQGDDDKGNNSEPTFSAAKRLLQSIASWGGGSYYYSRNSEDLPDVVFEQIVKKFNGQIIVKDSPVIVKRISDTVFDGMDKSQLASSFPDVSAFVYAGVKPSASTVLAIRYSDDATSAEVPLFAHWKYGKGKVATLTSFEGSTADSEDESWLAKWQGNALAQEFLSNVFDENIPEEKHSVPFDVEAEWDETNCRIVLKPPARHYAAFAVITVTKPDGTTDTQEMTPNETEFFYAFNAEEVGPYTFEIVYNVNSAEYVATETFCLSVMPEYNSFAVYDPSELYRALNGRGTVSTNGKLTVEENEDYVASYNVSLTVPLLIAAGVLFIIDIIVRKLKWEDIKSLFGLSKKKNKKGGVKQ